MSANSSQTSGPRENPEASEANALDRVLGRNRMNQVRQEIGMIADRSYRENIISDEAYEGYRKLAEGREEHKIGAQMLESTREFAKGHERKAIRVHQKITEAIRAGLASESDEDFLMEKLVVENIKFADKAEEVEGLIEQKLARMKKDREKYDKLAEHELIKDIGYLKVDASTRIDFPNAEEFLALTVPERRELLKKLEEALPKAEKYAQEAEEKEAKGLTADYEKGLKEALRKKIIGKKTYEKFLSGFKKIDHEEKEYWLSEFDAEMQRYETLWGQIRASLEGQALESIEGKIDQMGYTELLSEFGNIKGSESRRLSEGYTGELEKCREKGIIGRHTVAQFALWMNRQELSEKYRAAERLPDEMVRYEELWGNIAGLKKGQQEFLRSKINDWGYTELSQQYQRFSSGEDLGIPKSDESDRDSLSQLRSKEVKEAILETDEMLAGQGGGKKKAFMGILDKMFNRVNRDSFDATSFETQLRERVTKDNPQIKRDLKGRGANDEVDFGQIEGDAEILEESGSAKVTEDLGFIQVESKAAEGTSHRETQVTINEEDGMKRFFAEDGRHNYRAEETGGNDDLSLAILTDSGRTVELDLQEIRALQKHLKQREEEERLDKAA